MAAGNRAKTPAILIVEDEPLVRLYAVDAVVAAGFEVIESASADEALRMLECRSDIQVMFTDIQMPGSMDGLTLALDASGDFVGLVNIAQTSVVKRLNLGVASPL
ncbi:MAG: response regulator [Xanthobacteraceae bacterium]